MELHIQVMHFDKRVSLSEALKFGFVKIVDDRMIAQDGTNLSLSCRLSDRNGHELFENDVVRTSDGKQYIITFNFGVFHLRGISDRTTIPLYIYKLKNSVDVEKL